MDTCPLPFSPPALSSARVSDSRESTRRRSGCFLLRARGTWAGGRAGSDAPRGAHPHTIPTGAATCPGAHERGRASPVAAGAVLPTCRARCPPVPGPLRRARCRAGGCGVATCGTAGGLAIGMGLTSPRRGSLAGAPAALKPPFVPGQALALGIQVVPGGSEAETKQPSPWQCPLTRDECPQLGGEDGHKELPAGTGGAARGQATCHVPPEEEEVSPMWAQCPCLPRTPLVPNFLLACGRCWGCALPHAALLFRGPKHVSKGAKGRCEHNPNISPQRIAQAAWPCCWHRGLFSTHHPPIPVSRAPGQGRGLVPAGPGTCAQHVGETIAIDPCVP